MVPGWILAVIVDHNGRLLRPLHGGALLRAEPFALPRRCWHRMARLRRGVGVAAGDPEALVARHEWLVAVVSLVASAVGGPVGGVPDGAVRPHLPLREDVVVLASVDPDGHVVDEEDDLVGVPEDGVVVVVRGGVEPQVELHLPADDVVAVAGAAHVHVGLQLVGLSGDGAQQLHVDLVVVPRVQLVVRQLHIYIYTKIQCIRLII
jgi:hypothetical protein